MDNKQVAHLWANKSRASAKGSHFFFEGDTIYSYGSHFPIARHCDGVILFTRQDYSVTTSKHKSYVRMACTQFEVFTVENVKDTPGRADVLNYGKRINEAALAVARARDPQWKLKWMEDLIEEANKFCVHFGFKTRFTAPDNMEELKARAKVESDKKRKQTIARQERQERELAETVKRWISGEPVCLPHNYTKVYLRVKYSGQDAQGIGKSFVMETSKGATVPLAEAEKAFRFVMLKREKGWHRNGENFPIGEFHLDAVNANGVVAGCHRVGWDEIERFAKLQGWL